VVRGEGEVAASATHWRAPLLLYKVTCGAKHSRVAVVEGEGEGGVRVKVRVGGEGGVKVGG
jgi:hypothetical protein